MIAGTQPEESTAKVTLSDLVILALIPYHRAILYRLGSKHGT